MREEAEEIFADALEVHPSERDAFLKAACGGDKELQGEVEDLLRDADRADTFFEALSCGAPGLPGQAHAASKDKPGTLIGPYLLVRPLGRGGFGSVWLASQTLPLRRQVALKLIKRGMDSEEVLARFRAEQQVLAMMDHPNIARVFDAGAAPDGRPFFAMELVEGEKITTFCDARNLPIPERLKLFLQVCSALNHAHQRGVIHRDLKPSNILVTSKDGEPVAKVIDFGIARAIEGSLTGDHTLTQADQFVGTPSYMSPEQAGGQRAEIDTRTDVYSLGIVLYELLVGTVPFDEKTLAAAGREEIRRIIREEEPVRPSTRLRSLPADEQTGVAAARQVTPETLPRMVMAELDWIAMKAIDKAKERRYETMDALASDVQRFLGNEPVSARPPSTAYLLGKMARRHRAVLGTAAVIAVVLLAATATSLWLAFRARQAERLAEQRLQQVIDGQAAREKALKDAEAVSEFIVDLFRRPDPEKDGRNVKVADVLVGAEKDIAEKLADQPERALLLRRTLADTYQGLGLYPEALKLRREVYEQGQTVAPASSLESIDDLSSLAALLLRLGYYQDALECFRREVELREKQSPLQPQKLKTAREGEIEALYRTGEHERSRKLRQAFLPESSPPIKSGGPAPDAATPLTPEQRESLRLKSRDDLHKELQNQEATRPRLDAEVLRRMEFAADRFFWMLEHKAALQTQRDLVDRLREKYGPDHEVTIEATERLAFYCQRTGENSDIHELVASILERRRRLFGPEHPRSLLAEAAYAHSLKSDNEALPILERVVPLLQKVGGRNRTTFNEQKALAMRYIQGGRTPEGISLLKECVPHMLDDSYASILLARLLVWEGRDEEYQKLRKAVLAWASNNSRGMSTQPHIWERHMLNVCLQPLENQDDAHKVREIIRACKASRAASSLPALADNQYQQMVYGVVAYRLGDYEEARRCLEHSIALGKNEAPRFQNRVSMARIFLAMTMAALGDEDAAKLYAEVRPKVSDPLSAEHPLVGRLGGEGSVLHTFLAKREADEIFKPSPTANSDP